MKSSSFRSVSPRPVNVALSHSNSPKNETRSISLVVEPSMALRSPRNRVGKPVSPTSSQSPLKKIFKQSTLLNRLEMLGFNLPIYSKSFSNDEVVEIEHALDVLNLANPKNDDAWPHIVSACICGEEIKFKAVHTLLRYQLLDPCMTTPAYGDDSGDGQTLLHAIAGDEIQSDFYKKINDDGEVQQDEQNKYVPVENRIALLIYMGADVDQPDLQGKSALHIASEIGNENAVKALLIKGADVTKKCNEGNTPLDYAIKSDCPKVVGSLINFDKDKGEDEDKNAADKFTLYKVIKSAIKQNSLQVS